MSSALELGDAITHNNPFFIFRDYSAGASAGASSGFSPLGDLGFRPPCSLILYSFAFLRFSSSSRIAFLW